MYAKEFFQASPGKVHFHFCNDHIAIALQWATIFSTQRSFLCDEFFDWNSQLDVPGISHAPVLDP
jgi:hypothetical protein